MWKLLVHVLVQQSVLLLFISISILYCHVVAALKCSHTTYLTTVLVCQSVDGFNNELLRTMKTNYIGVFMRPHAQVVVVVVVSACRLSVRTPHVNKTTTSGRHMCKACLRCEPLWIVVQRFDQIVRPACVCLYQLCLCCVVFENSFHSLEIEFVFMCGSAVPNLFQIISPFEIPTNVNRFEDQRLVLEMYFKFL